MTQNANEVTNSRSFPQQSVFFASSIHSSVVIQCFGVPEDSLLHCQYSKSPCALLDSGIKRFFFFIYRDIGFKRKAAFFLRVAAMRCVAPNNPHPDWALCYNLLLKANAGYCIQLSNTLALNPTFNGWPALQVSLVLCLLFVNPYSALVLVCPYLFD